MNTHTHPSQPRSISKPAAGILSAFVLSAAASGLILHPEYTQPIVDRAGDVVTAAQAYVQQTEAAAGRALEERLYPAGDIDGVSPSAYPSGYDQFSPFDSYFGRSTRV